MKLNDTKKYKWKISNFLTHTVQMKLLSAVIAITAVIPIFLTHTVQMKPLPYKFFVVEVLGFLTHTVQMKPLPYKFFVVEVLGFLTHTVQMKLLTTLT